MLLKVAAILVLLFFGISIFFGVQFRTAKEKGQPSGPYLSAVILSLVLELVCLFYVLSTVMLSSKIG